ncbi:MAG: EAL domain-containing protein [Thiobacillus sp.]
MTDAANPRCPVSVEALARWHDDKYGGVNPADFIPLAENMGLIQEVGRQVLEQALDYFSQHAESCTALMGVEMLQGYNFSRPVPEEVCADFIAGLQAPRATAAPA